MWWWVRACPHGWQTSTYSLHWFWNDLSYWCSIVCTFIACIGCLLHLGYVTVLPYTRVYLFVPLCSHVFTCLSRPSLVQSFVGSLWIGRSRAALMSFMASCSMCIASPMWSCWWAMLMCTATCCPSTMMTTTTRPSPQPALYSGCSCRGKVRTEQDYDWPWHHLNFSF